MLVIFSFILLQLCYAMFMQKFDTLWISGLWIQITKFRLMDEL